MGDSNRVDGVPVVVRNIVGEDGVCACDDGGVLMGWMASECSPMSSPRLAVSEGESSKMSGS